MARLHAGGAATLAGGQGERDGFACDSWLEQESIDICKVFKVWLAGWVIGWRLVEVVLSAALNQLWQFELLNLAADEEESLVVAIADFPATKQPDSGVLSADAPGATAMGQTDDDGDRKSVV